MKQTIRLNERELKQIIRESVVTILNENVDEWSLFGNKKTTFESPAEVKQYLDKLLPSGYVSFTSQKYGPSRIFIANTDSNENVGSVFYKFDDGVITYSIPGREGNTAKSLETALEQILGNAQRPMNEKVDKDNRNRGNRNYSDYDELTRHKKAFDKKKRAEKRVKPYDIDADEYDLRDFVAECLKKIVNEMATSELNGRSFSEWCEEVKQDLMSHGYKRMAMDDGFVKKIASSTWSSVEDGDADDLETSLSGMYYELDDEYDIYRQNAKWKGEDLDE